MNRGELATILEAIVLAHTISSIGVLVGLGATDDEIDAIIDRIETEEPPEPLTSDRASAVLGRYRDLLREQRGE